MKHNQNHDNGPSAGPHLVPIRFEYADSAATTVCVAGSFNHWQPTSKPLHPHGSGHWLKETALAPGIYEYRLVVDGRWITDPVALETVPNPFGERNSVLRVPDSSEAAHLVNAAQLPLRIAHD